MASGKWFPNPLITSPKVLTEDKRRIAVSEHHTTMTVRDVCDKAGVSYGVIGGFEPQVILVKWGNKKHYVAKDEHGRSQYFVNLLSSAISDYPSSEMYVRILEVLAYGFADYSARESARLLFSAKVPDTRNDVPPERRSSRMP